MMRNLVLAALFCAACSSVGGVGASLQPIAGDPFAGEIAAFAEADAMAPPARCQILFVGSSSIRMWDTLAEDMAPRRVINRGFGGSTIADVNRYFDEVVRPYRPRAIVFYAGENEINMGAEPSWVVATFAEFMRLKREALEDTPVYFISLKPSRARVMQLEHQNEVNEAIAAMAERQSDLVFVDVTLAMLRGGVPEDHIYLDDGLHMNAAGYAIWRRIVRQALDQPMPTEARGCG